MTKYEVWLEYVKDSRQNLKIRDATLHLKLLDNFLNSFGGKLLITLYGPWIEKIKLNCVGMKKQGHEFESFYSYGHVKCGPTKESAKNFRLSTCINKNGTITIPKYEYQYFEKGNYTFLTTGDLFLIVDNKKMYRRFSKLSSPIYEQTGNYVIPISWLFENNLVHKFGYLYGDTFKEGYSKKSYKLKTKLPKNFDMVKLRGCLNGNEPKYIVAKIANSDQEEYFEYLGFSSVKSILDTSKCSITTWQGLRKQANTNTKNIELGIIPTKKSILNYNGIDCLLFANKNLNLNMIRDYCSQYD